MSFSSAEQADQAVQEAERPAAWAAVGALTLGVFALVTSEFLPASVLTPLARDLGVSVGAAGQAVTATAVVGAFAAPLVPVLTGRLDRRLVMWGLMALLVFSNLLTIFAANLTILLVARVLLGASLGGFWSMAAALAIRLVPPSGVPKAMSLIFAGVSVATVSAAPIGAYVGDTLGWRAAFVIAGVVSGVALLAQLLTLPRLAPTSVPRLAGLVEVGRRPAVATALLGVLLVISGHFAGFTYVRPVLEQIAQLDVKAISLTLLAFGGAGFFGNLAGAALVGRDPRLSVLSGAALIAVAASVIVLLGQFGLITAIALTLWGFAFAMLPVGFQSWATSAATDQAELAGGLLTSTFQVAIAAGAVLGGVLVDQLGPLSAPGYAAVSAVAAAGLVLMLRRRAVSVAATAQTAACEACS